jgi:ubiquinone/menaquinone biosynthesis C-methylase UbiE
MDTRDCNLSAEPLLHPPESLFERCSWFYALCREYLFRDHTPEISRSLFPCGGPSPGTHVVEVGCGPGFYSCRLAEEFPQLQTTGVDLSEPLLRRAKRRARRRSLPNCTFCRGDAHALPGALGPVDALVVSRLFLIVENREAVVREIFRVLRPGGRCFIAEPTSGFRTRIPLGCMWILSKFPYTPAGGYKEPQQADVMSRGDFSDLIYSQPWGSVAIEYDGWYQYAVCQKSSDLSDSCVPRTLDLAPIHNGSAA